MLIPGAEKSVAGRASVSKVDPPAPRSSLLLGPAFLGVSISIQLMLTGLIVFGPIKNPTLPAGLTNMARDLVHPERDMSIYVAGVAVAMILVLLLWIAGYRLRDARHRPGL